MKPIHKQGLVEIVIDRLKSYIVENQLQPGDRLPSESEMIERLGVSRTVIREALKSMQVLGILRVKAGDGIYLNDPSIRGLLEQISYHWKANRTKMKELLDTRRALELGAVEMAIEHYSIDHLREMERWNERLAAKIDSKQSPGTEDLEFHRTLFKATGNEIYSELSTVVYDFFNTSRLNLLNDFDSLKLSLEEHREMVYWIMDKNKAKAAAVMKRHLAKLYEYL